MIAQKLVADKVVINGSLNFLHQKRAGQPMDAHVLLGVGHAGYARSRSWCRVRSDLRQRSLVHGGRPARAHPAAAKERAGRRYITAEFTRLNARLGTTDRARLDAHLTAVRALEDRIARSEALTSGLHCTPPMKHAIGAGVAVQRNVGGMETNNNASNETDLQDRHTIWREMTVRALACDLTRVVTVMWAPSRADTYLPWLGFAQPHHALSHDNNVPKLTTIDNWYAGLLALYIKDIKAEVDENGDSLFRIPLSSGATSWERWRAHAHQQAAPSRRERGRLLQDGTLRQIQGGDSPQRVANSPRAIDGRCYRPRRRSRLQGSRHETTDGVAD